MKDTMAMWMMLQEGLLRAEITIFQPPVFRRPIDVDPLFASASLACAMFTSVKSMNCVNQDVKIIIPKVCFNSVTSHCIVLLIFTTN